MQRGEKFLVSLLVAILFVSLGQLFFSEFHFISKQEDGVFSEGMIGKIHTLNPLFVDFNDADRDMSELIFSGLIRYDPIKKNFYPDLAKAWTRSKDDKTYTFDLRPNVLWHDAKPFTADDVVFTFKNVIQDPGFRNPILKNAFEEVGVTKSGPHEVTFTLPRSNSYFISNLTAGILPKHLLENSAIATMEQSPFSQQPVGTGPYKVTKLSIDSDGDYIDLVAFDQYYDDKPVISHIRFFTYPNENSLMSDATSLSAVSKLSSKSEGAAALAASDKFSIYNYTLNQFTAIYYNTDHPVLKDKKVRQALTKLLDKNSFILAGEQRVDSVGLYDRSDEEIFKSAPVEGEKMLDELGWKKGTDGMRVNEKGEKLSFLFLTISKMPKQLVENIQKQWKSAGIEINVQAQESESFSAQLSERRYAILLIRQNLGYNRDIYPLFHSSQATPIGLNFSNFKSFRTDGLTEAIRKETDSKSKEKLLVELSKAVSDETPVVFISTPVYSYALPKGLEEFQPKSLDFHSDRLSIVPFLTSINP